MIEDTSFIVDVLHDDPDALQYLGGIETENRPEKVASITVLELYEAVPQLDVPEERQRKIPTFSIPVTSSTVTRP